MYPLSRPHLAPYPIPIRPVAYLLSASFHQQLGDERDVRAAEQVHALDFPVKHLLDQLVQHL